MTSEAEISKPFSLKWRGPQLVRVNLGSSNSTSPVHYELLSGLFGLRQYGIDINGYVNHSVKGPCLWMQRRSKTKPTWAGMLDNFVRGKFPSIDRVVLVYGIILVSSQLRLAGDSPRDTAFKKPRSKKLKRRPMLMKIRPGK